MLWIYYIGGRGKSGKLVLIKIGISADPEAQLSALTPLQAFDLELLGFEEGSPDLLEERKMKFQKIALKNDWYHAKSELLVYIAELPRVTLEKGNMKKICVDLTPDEWNALVRGVEETDSRTKTRLIRRALKFYTALGRYKALGYMLQVLRGGKYHVFTDLDDIKDPEDIDI